MLRALLRSRENSLAAQSESDSAAQRGELAGARACVMAAICVCVCVSVSVRVSEECDKKRSVRNEMKM